jgi:hypothetical protein
VPATHPVMAVPPVHAEPAGQLPQTRSVVDVQAVVSRVPAAHTAVQPVALTPLQKLLAGQAPQTRLVVEVHALVSYWLLAQAAVQPTLAAPPVQ